ncbi:DUF2975 domain-containing protein [Streptomyces nodosus]|uniref:DUF2975 domain-containing protein n=1 Tax=Streptomyces nodosus TaxID=40318 RepID=A0A0B5DE73_9ACTN|nr:DUF2975 domain-containing protein [Streptomyces nodosus]AJE38756.1 hypothetical protein SNOD_00600 [Streptomyces nodosus]MBB4789491.1 hypothetical protein [Streptomyces nodosus]QEV37335.1 DUF2975 domain-containing protein [Streptomyces nodosus]
MHSIFIAMLRVGIAAAMLLGLFGQIVVIPTTATDEVDRFPPYEPFAAPYVTVAIALVLCVQVALGAVWMLLTMVERDAIFTWRAFRLVDTVIGAALVATLLMAGVSAHVALADIPSPGDGMDVISALGAATVATAVGAAFMMLVVVMRGLLLKATNLQSESAKVA